MDLLDNVKQKATAELDSQKGRATDGLSAIAQAVRGTTEELRKDQHDVMAQYIERMADSLEQFSTQLREKDLTALLSDARQLARRQPAVFIGGSFAAGLIAARFLKSSRRSSREGGWSDDDYTRRDDYSSRSHGEYTSARAGERTTFGGTRTASFDEPGIGGIDTPGTSGFGDTGLGTTGRL